MLLDDASEGNEERLDFCYKAVYENISVEFDEFYKEKESYYHVNVMPIDRRGYCAGLLCNVRTEMLDRINTNNELKTALQELKKEKYVLDKLCTDFTENYANKYLSEEERNNFRKWLDCNNMRNKLVDKDRATFHYMSIPNSNNEIISSIAKTYYSIYRIDLNANYFEEISNHENAHRLTGNEGVGLHVR